MRRATHAASPPSCAKPSTRADRVQEPDAEFLGRGKGAPGAFEMREFIGMTQVEVRESRRRPEQRPEGVPPLRVALQRADGSGVPPHDPDERGQGGIRVGSGGRLRRERLPRQPERLLELAEAGLGRRELAEADPGQPGQGGRALDGGHRGAPGQSISRLLFNSKGVTCVRYSCHSLRLLSRT